jgi:hypothetical protein
MVINGSNGKSSNKKKPRQQWLDDKFYAKYHGFLSEE